MDIVPRRAQVIRVFLLELTTILNQWLVRHHTNIKKSLLHSLKLGMTIIKLSCREFLQQQIKILLCKNRMENKVEMMEDETNVKSTGGIERSGREGKKVEK